MRRRVFSTDSIWARAGASGVVVGLVVGIGVSVLGSFAPPSASADSSSAVTVASKGYDLNIATAPFPNLAVTVSKTSELVSQGIQVSWTGGKKSVRPSTGFGGQDFLQIAQCWGEDPDNPGHPDRTTCQYGAFLSSGATRDAFVSDKDVADQDRKYTARGTGYFDPTYTSIPFRASTGETVTSVVPDASGALVKNTDTDVNTNPFFTQYTSNETKWAGTGSDGTGSVKFEIQTSMQSPGLGCGAPIIKADAPVIGQSCWLVIIPRGQSDSGTTFITQPGLFWDAWQHHVAVKLAFKPVGIRCSIGSAETQVAGSELASGAVGSWQPNLCTGTTGSAFVLSAGDEADVLAKASKTQPSALALTSRPLETTTIDPLEYAPIGLSGVALTFAIDRRTTPVGVVPPQYKDLDSQPFTAMNLTPRLIAKLLTGSYTSSLPAGANLLHIGYTNVDNPGKNARILTTDRDFLDVNDVEWEYQDLSSTSLSDLLVPTGRSDLANQLWRYVLADADAVAFLQGKPDPWGMTVNPWYSITAGVNPTGTGLSLPRDTFPKADPVEKLATTGANGIGPVNLVTWRPFTSDFEQGAYLTLRGDGQVLGGWDTSYTPPKYAKSTRSLVGDQGVLAITTTAAAARYQNVTASLRNASGKFVAPTSESMSAAAAAMTPTAKQPRVLEYDPAARTTVAAVTAYPLTMPIYAATNPRQTDNALRAKYANLIRYAATTGQVQGAGVGELPEGYAPIPKSWSEQALIAASAIEKGSNPVGVQNPMPPSEAPGGAPAAPIASTPAASRGTNAVVAPALGVVVPVVPPTIGAAAGPLIGRPTPADPRIGPVAAAVPAGLLSGLLAAGAIPLISRVRRKS